MGDLIDLGARRASRTGPSADAQRRFAAAVRAVGGRDAMARELTARLGRPVRAALVTTWATRVVAPADVLLAAEEAAGACTTASAPTGPITASVMAAARRCPSPVVLDALADAMEADHLLRYAVTVSASAVRDLSRHPLASRVMTRRATDLLAWPFTGQAPAGLEDCPAPVVSLQDRAAFFSHHREAVERAAVEHPEPDAPQPVRQCLYFAQWEPSSAEWCRGVDRAERQAWHPDLGWTPRWVTARSGAVTAARQGDPGPLRAFVRLGLEGRPECEDADLAYWAHWVGEDAGPWATDEAMTLGLRTDGRTLLERLTAGIVPGDPLLDLTVHSCRALLARRPRLRQDPAARAQLRQHARAVLDAGGLITPTRRKLTLLAR